MRRRDASRLLCIYFLSLCFCACVANSVKAQTESEGETIRVDTGLVNLNVSIIASDRKLKIDPLQKNEFAIFENGNAEEIKFFATSETPLS